MAISQFSIHPLMDMWIFSTFWPLWIMLLWTFVYQFNFLWTYVYSPLGYLPRSGIARSYGVVTQCLVFWRTARLFSTTAASFYIPTSCVWGFWFFYILANIRYCLFDSRCHLVSSWNIHREKNLEANSTFVDVFCVLGIFFCFSKSSLACPIPWGLTCLDWPLDFPAF